jgi:hypothetical protein
MDEAVSDFFMDICQLNSQPNEKRLAVWMHNATNLSLTMIGSCSDTYIEPITPWNGAIDMLQCSREHLAVQSSRDIPRHLPPPFADTVMVMTIVDTEFACHVKLRTVGQLTRKVTG